MGGVWALKLTGTPFSISAAVGFISIFGVAVQDGVLLISYFNQMRAAGLPVREAVMRGAELRVRPVVMTSLTAALGLLAGRAGQLHRLAGTEAAGDRGGRRNAGHLVPDQVLDARALQLLPRSGRKQRVRRRSDRGVSLHRSVLRAANAPRLRPTKIETGPIHDPTAGDPDDPGAGQGGSCIMKTRLEDHLSLWRSGGHRRLAGRSTTSGGAESSRPGTSSPALLCMPARPRPNKEWTESPAASREPCRDSKSSASSPSKSRRSA